MASGHYTICCLGFAAGLLLASLPSADGHGYIVEPPARNAQGGPRNGYCPHCGNGHGICGDGGQWPSDSNYVQDNAGPVRTYRAGEVVEFKVKITAHHKGHFELAVCDQHLGPSMANPQACLNRFRLLRVPPEEVYSDCQPNDVRGTCQPMDMDHPERWYLPPGNKVHTMHFRIPTGLQCTSCTLQWQWWTANSCIPADGYSKYFSHMKSLGWDTAAWGFANALLQTGRAASAHRSGSARAGCGEEFRNCADITVLAAGPGPAPAPPAPPAPPPPAAPTPQPSGASPTPAPMGPQPACVPIADCGMHDWCDQPTYTAWCKDKLAAGGCPTTFCKLQAAEPEPEPQPLPAPVPAPAPAPAPPASSVCGTCSACLWSNGACYTDASESYCKAWSSNTWCGSASLMEIKQHGHDLS